MFTLLIRNEDCKPISEEIYPFGSFQSLCDFLVADPDLIDGVYPGYIYIQKRILVENAYYSEIRSATLLDLGFEYVTGDEDILEFLKELGRKNYTSRVEDFEADFEDKEYFYCRWENVVVPKNVCPLCSRTDLVSCGDLL